VDFIRDAFQSYGRCRSARPPGDASGAVTASVSASNAAVLRGTSAPMNLFQITDDYVPPKITCPMKLLHVSSDGAPLPV
jgi:hypothetical protein